MLDPQLLRQDLEHVAAALARRGYHLDMEQFASLESSRKQLQTRVEELQSRRNKRSKEIGSAKAAGEDIEPLKQEVADLASELESSKRKLEDVRAALDHLLLDMPNLPADDVPAGKDDGDNVEISRSSEPPELDFEPRDHVELGEMLGGIDFERASRLSGARFAVLGGQVARLHRARRRGESLEHTRKSGAGEKRILAPATLFVAPTGHGTGSHWH